MPQVFQALGVTGFMVMGVLTLGAFLLTLRCWRLAPGAFTLVLGLNALAMGFLDQPYPLA